MVIQDSVSTLGTSLTDLWAGVLGTVPAILMAIVIFVIGWVIASVLARVVAEVVRTLKVDHALEGAGVGHALRRAGINLNSGAFFGGLVHWFIVVAFFMASLNIVGLNTVTDYLRETVLGFLPKVFVSALILIVTSIVADVVGKVVSGSAKAAHLHMAGTASVVARWAILIVGFIAAIQTLIEIPIVQVLSTGIIAGLALAFGLAFGLGGKDTAARFLERTREEMSKRD